MCRRCCPTGRWCSWNFSFTSIPCESIDAVANAVGVVAGEGGCVSCLAVLAAHDKLASHLHDVAGGR